jgi:ketosteroid isomerase-like protein
MTPAEMDRLIEEHFAYEAADDVEGVLSTVTDDIVHDVVGFPGGPQHGKEAVRAFYEMLFAVLKQERYEVLHRYHGTDVMVDEVLYTAHIDGAMVGLEGQAGRASWRLLHVLEFRDGKIARENVWQDVDAIRTQLEGAVPAASI